MHKTTHKTVHSISIKELGRIHWRKYMTRKIVILSAFGLAGYAADHYLHIWMASKGAELAFGTVVEHLLFEIPVEES